MLQTRDIGVFSVVIQMIGGTLTAVIHDAGVAVVFMLEVVKNWKAVCVVVFLQVMK